MRIEIWSDLMCPFCYIGKRRLEKALEQFPHSGEVEVVYRSFELDPHSKRDGNPDVHTYLAGKFGMPREQAEAMNANVAAQARSVGLDYRFDTMILTNTFDAHRLIHFAGRSGRMKEMTERLFYAYFTESKHIGDPEVLAELAEETGLDREEARRMLAGDDCTEEVRADEREAARLGIRGVPHAVIDGKYAVSGAQPSDVFLQALHKARQEG